MGPRLMPSILERTLESAVAESWIRDSLTLHPRGAELTVSGACMAPAIPEGSRVRLARPLTTPRVGDVVLLRTPHGLRLHRILVRFRGSIRTKGDQGTYLDPPISAQAVIAAWQSAEWRTQRLLRAGLSLFRLLFRHVRPAPPELLELR